MTDHEDRREGDHADGGAAPFLMGGGVVAEVIELVERRPTPAPTEPEAALEPALKAEAALLEVEAEPALKAEPALLEVEVEVEPTPVVIAPVVIAPVVPAPLIAPVEAAGPAALPAPPAPSALRPSAPRPVVLPGDDATVTRRMRATLSLVMVIVLAAGLAALLVAVAVVALVVALRRVAG